MSQGRRQVAPDEEDGKQEEEEEEEEDVVVLALRRSRWRIRPASDRDEAGLARLEEGGGPGVWDKDRSTCAWGVGRQLAIAARMDGVGGAAHM